MYIKRILQPRLLSSLEPNKVLVLYGPRRVGKTALLAQIETELRNQGERVASFAFAQ